MGFQQENFGLFQLGIIRYFWGKRMFKSFYELCQRLDWITEVYAGVDTFKKMKFQKYSPIYEAITHFLSKREEYSSREQNQNSNWSLSRSYMLPPEDLFRNNS
jgi:hypothetical protein